MTATIRQPIATLVSPDGHSKVLFFQGLMTSPKTAEGPHVSYVCQASSANRAGQFNDMGTFADSVGNVRNMWRGLVKVGWEPA
jgi:hypothetical protein